MGIIRRKHFTIPDRQVDDIELIDTPEKLIRFAQSKGITIIPFDVQQVAIKLGIDVQFVDFKNDLSGILYKDIETSSWKMGVNKAHHPNRQRYTIAHELGHYCLHRYVTNFFEDEIYFRGSKTSKTEWQANNFASAILMPEDKLRQEIHSGVSEVEELAKIFKVSSLALRIRAKTLGMTGHGL